MPATRARGALTRVGLPYAQDPGITRHLAAFLTRQRGAADELEGFQEPLTEGGFLRPSAVLFNGGVFKADPLRKRVLALLRDWNQGTPVRELAGSHLDLAVAISVVSLVLAFGALAGARLVVRRWQP